MQMGRRLQSPTDSDNATSPEEVSETRTPSSKKATTQDANEDASMCTPWIQRIHFASVGLRR